MTTTTQEDSAIRNPQSAILLMRGVTKSFPGAQALAGVDFTLRRGEIHALVGENGAGKSTLMKILAGVVAKDDGEIIFDGGEINPQNAAEAQSLGVSFVHQELSLAPNLTVAENIFVRREPRRLGLINWRELNTRAKELLDQFELEIAPDAMVKDLSLAKRQIAEIAKALSVDAKLLILDEPTSSLETHEVELLFKLLRRLAARGLGLVYITHKMDEIFRIADRVTVLRDGRLVGTRERDETNADEIIRMMVGRELEKLYPPKAGCAGEVVFELRGLTARGKFSDVNLSVRSGEILGLAGLIGSGRTETMMAAIGHARLDGGEVLIDGKPVRIDSPGDALRLGVVYSPEDRKYQGLFLSQSVQANIVAASLNECSGAGLMRRSIERGLSAGFARDLAIKTPGLEQPVGALSGGNQQKVLLAKWLATRPRVLIVDEPTRGVDVGSKSEIHHLLRRFTEAGGAVIMISSELPEILGMSDRVVVFHEGRVAGELSGNDASEEKIMRLATGA
ncbi:MAG: Ribose import ATP-binding protein RbsA [Acidobacteria bacterium]|nr:Ribose import ATP-binding protein RbsA [Acidobacteriota bacterium]